MYEMGDRLDLASEKEPEPKTNLLDETMEIGDSIQDSKSPQVLHPISITETLVDDEGNKHVYENGQEVSSNSPDNKFDSAHQFAKLVEYHFDSMDLNKDKVLTLEELKVGKSKVDESSELGKVTNTMHKRISELSRLIRGDENSLSYKEAKGLVTLTRPELCRLDDKEKYYEDGFTRMQRVGALFDMFALESHMGDDSFETLKEARKAIKSWDEFEFSGCSVFNSFADETITKYDTKLVEDRVDDILENHKNWRRNDLSSEEVLEKVSSVEEQFSEIDTNNDELLSVHEIAESIRNKKLTSDQESTAAVLARNIVGFSQLNDSDSSSGMRISRDDFKAAPMLFEEASTKSAIMRNLKIAGSTVGGGLGGCLWGTVGSVVTGFVGAIPGCVGGAVVGGAGAYAVSSRVVEQSDPLGAKIGRWKALQMRKQLRSLSN